MRTLMLSVCLAVAAMATAEPIALVNVHVIPMTANRVLRDHVVVVEAGRIRSVGPRDATTIPENATTIDGEGGFLIPGLIDLHAHLGHGGESLFVLNGVTTVLLAGDGVRSIEGALAPNVVACGPSIVGVKTAAEAEKVVEAQKTAGFDCIKIYDEIDAEALQPLVHAARKRNMLSIAHIPRNLTWQQMLAAKPDAIAHLEEFLYSPVDVGEDHVIVGRMLAGDIAVISTLTTYDVITRQVADLETMFERGENAYIAADHKNDWTRDRNRYRGIQQKQLPKMRRLLVFQKDLARMLSSAGGRVLAGTDAGGPPFVIPGFSMTDELRLLVSAGLAPYDALRAATVEAARFLKRDELGTIEAGKAADLVLLRGDPLRDIDNVALRAGVMVRGRWLDAAAIGAELDRIRVGSEGASP